MSANNMYAIVSESGEYVMTINEADFIKLTNDDVIIDRTWQHHVDKFGFGQYDYVWRKQ